MFNIGTQELLLILLAVLLLFGARRIPEVARALGKGLGDFRDAMSGIERELKGEAPPPTAPRPAVPAAAQSVPAAESTAGPSAGPTAPGSGAGATEPEPEPAESSLETEPPRPPGPGSGLAG